MDLSASEHEHEMGILLVAVGKVDRKVFDFLKEELKKTFNRPVWVGEGLPDPDYAFNSKRKQYLSTAILKSLLDEKGRTLYEKMLGIVDHDLYVPEMSFVFGEAGRKVAVISLARLRQEFYHLPPDHDLFQKRVLTEAVHELGHTYGLRHCENPRCVMFFSNHIKDTDRKGPDLCPKCKLQFSERE
jgi:archaemetzincin